MLSALHKRAFSLIELLVTVSIMLLLFSGALAAYIRYTEKQRIVAAAETLEAMIKEVQNRSKTGYLANCSELASNNFRLWIENGELVYQLSTFCTNSAENSYESVVSLGEDFTLDVNFRLRFQPFASTLINQVNPSTGNRDVIVSQLSSTRRPDYVVSFTIDRGGGIKVQY